MLLPLLATLLTGTPGDEPTFTRDIAPLIFQRCSACHHPGEAAPFALLDYRDVQKRAAQIVRVTGSRYMPPWLPDSRLNHYRGDRSLSEEQIELLRRWSEAGCPEGDPADLPPTPHWPAGWTLGEPDLVVAMDASYTVPAEGRDVYRNFVIPAPVEAARWIRAVEFHPDNRSVLHHAVLFVDGSRQARAEDARDPEPGYPAMGLGLFRAPNGQFIGWTPGKGPVQCDEGVAWRLDRGIDIVLQLHLRPTGKPEPIRIELGLYYAEQPPERAPMTIRLWSREIDIPAGEPAYAVESTYRLPVDLAVLGVYPHAHYLGKDLRGWAELPDGTRRDLVHVASWDFNWQEEYFYAEPLPLPKGSVLHMRWVYDNSSDNPFNPSQPPRRVVHGYQSSDEMGELLLSVLPAERDRPILWNDFVQHAYDVDLANLERQVESHPGNPRLRDQIIKYCFRLERGAEAEVHARALLALQPGQVEPLLRLGQALLMQGKLEPALSTLRAARDQNPNHPRAHFLLARAEQQAGHLEQALEILQPLAQADPGNFMVQNSCGEVLAGLGRREEALRHLEAALATNPEHLRALSNIAAVRLAEGKTDEALELCERVLDISPDEAGAHDVLGQALMARGRVEEARWHFELAVRFDPGETAFRERLARAEGRQGDGSR